MLAIGVTSDSRTNRSNMASTTRSALLLHDASLNVTHLNDAARHLLDGERYLGRPVEECLAMLEGANEAQPARLKLRDHVRGRLAFALKINGALWRVEPVALIAAPGPDHAEPASSDEGAVGMPVGALVLREAGQAVDYRDFALDRVDFLASLSHDLRTPLNAMTGWLHLLSSADPRNTELRQRAVAGLQRAVEQQQRLLVERLDGRPRLESESNAEPLGTAQRSDDMTEGSREKPARRSARRHDEQAVAAMGLAIASRHGFDATLPSGAEGPHHHGLQGVYVLAIDDTPEMLEVLTQVLASDGAVVEPVASADEALARYPQWAASGGERLVVSDLAMPGRDGISLIREIRAVERENRMPRLPAVAISAHGVPEVRRRAIEHGYDLFLDKPVSPPAMLTQLHRLLDR